MTRQKYVPRHRRDVDEISPVCPSCGHTTIERESGDCVNPWCERNAVPDPEQ